MQGIQPKNNNKGNAQMLVIFLLASVWHAIYSQGESFGAPICKGNGRKIQGASQLENQSQAFYNEFHKQQRIQKPEKKPLNLVHNVRSST